MTGESSKLTEKANSEAEIDMEQFRNIKERKRPADPGRQNGTRAGRAHAPLFASPWVALFVILRREFRQPRTASN